MTKPKKYKQMGWAFMKQGETHFLIDGCRSRSFGIGQFVCRNKYKFTWPEAKKLGWRCVKIFVEGE